MRCNEQRRHGPEASSRFLLSLRRRVAEKNHPCAVHLLPNSFSISPCASFTQVGRPWLHWPDRGVTLHLAQQRVHFGDRQRCARRGPSRGRPWSPRHDRAARPASRASPSNAASSSARSGPAPGRRLGPACGGHGAHQHRARAEAFELQTDVGRAPPRAPPAGRRRARPVRPPRAAAKPGARLRPFASAARIRSSTSRSCAACWSTITSPSSASATI